MLAMTAVGAPPTRMLRHFAVVQSPTAYDAGWSEAARSAAEYATGAANMSDIQASA